MAKKVLLVRGASYTYQGVKFEAGVPVKVDDEDALKYLDSLHEEMWTSGPKPEKVEKKRFEITDWSDEDDEGGSGDEGGAKKKASTRSRSRKKKAETEE